MAQAYDIEVNRELTKAFAAANLHRPMRVARYDAGDHLQYTVTGVAPAGQARVHLVIDKFIGGGFAGQVYRVKVLDIQPIAPASAEPNAPAPIPGIEVGGTYAMKILIPPSKFSVAFRNLIYWLGFQGSFSLQVNPAAARCGALWQKFIRRASAIRFGSDQAVVDILATFIDSRLGSCGELSEWVSGRNWQFEVDDRISARKHWRVGDPIPESGSAEYLAKKQFMADLVALFHEIGAHELARQYEWFTCKSQPNCLKRLGHDDDPAAGLTAVDFRAGLALLPCLPMSPGDFKLIFSGLRRGSLVQFDRGDIGKLESFVLAHRERFADMLPALDELKSADREYRDSLIDVTHHHTRLLRDGRLWKSICLANVQSWRIRGLTDDSQARRLKCSGLMVTLFSLLGALSVIGAAAFAAALVIGAVLLFSQWRGQTDALQNHAAWLIPVALSGLVASFAARMGRTVWGRSDLRRHYRNMLTSADYFSRAIKGHMAERLIDFNRQGRLTPEKIRRVQGSFWRFLPHAMLSRLPAGLHRFLTDRRFAWDKLTFIVMRPIRLYFNPAEREQWLRDMLDDGLRQGMVTEVEAQTIRAQLSEPFIQKYLKCLAVHVCTLPITQIVSLIVAIFVATRYGRSWQESWALALTILALFQVTPISPGSLTRGLYVLYMVIRERNYRDYKIAVWLGFWKYIGYLAFPIQMAYRYPAIARFMAGRWSTGAVHIVPVFGEHGALLEHAMFDLFYNRPLSIRRQMEARQRLRRNRPVRRWHAPATAAAAYAVAALLPAVALYQASAHIVDWVHPALATGQPTWWMMLLAAIASGFIISRLVSGGGLKDRIILGGLGGLLIALANAAYLAAGQWGGDSTILTKSLGLTLFFQAFYCVVAGVAAAIIAELTLPDPELPAVAQT